MNADKVLGGQVTSFNIVRSGYCSIRIEEGVSDSTKGVPDSTILNEVVVKLNLCLDLTVLRGVKIFV